MRMISIGDDRVHELEQKHRMLDAEVSRLERRVYLTPVEQRLMTDLKKQKLRTKDELMAIRRG